MSRARLERRLPTEHFEIFARRSIVRKSNLQAHLAAAFASALRHVRLEAARKFETACGRKLDGRLADELALREHFDDKLPPPGASARQFGGPSDNTSSHLGSVV